MSDASPAAVQPSMASFSLHTEFMSPDVLITLNLLD